MLKLMLNRPLAVFDIEATGTTPRADRIVELAVVKLMPDGPESTHVFRVNPQIPIPPDAAKIHGITDADVKNCPSFCEIAPEVFRLFEGCDLAGYNILRFDIPLLIEEFLRADLRFDITTRRIIDAQRIFHKQEPRDLSAALAFYCGETCFKPHGAESDVRATLLVLEGQFGKYPDLPRNLDELDIYCNPKKPEWVDRTGKLKWYNNEIVLNFSRKKGTPLKDLIKNDPNFVKWIMKSDFPRDMQEIVKNAMENNWPHPPVGADQ